MAKLLGIDIGTSGCKALLIDEFGAVIGEGQSEYPLSVPKPLWSEQSPADWWSGVQQSLSQIDLDGVSAIGLTGQMHGAVFLDADDEVIRPAILWNDQRTSAECAEIDQRVGADRVRAITCNPPLTGFQAPKVLWLRNNEPENFARVRSVLLPKDYIRWKMTGKKAGEVSDSSGTGVFDVPNRTWSQEMLGKLELPSEWFPEVSESHLVTATTRSCPGLPDGLPVVGGGGDQAAGAVGTGAVESGVVSVSLGTSGVVFTALDAPKHDRAGAAHTFCHANESWHAMGVMLSCGGALRWFRDVFSTGSTYEFLSEIAAAAPAGSNGVTFLPYLSGERTPHLDPFAQGVFAGLTLGANRDCTVRAVFEGVTFGLADGMDILRSLGAQSGEVRVTSGGAKSPFWIQLLADVFGCPCVTLESDEGPAFGAAILAGVGIGVWPSVVSACRKVVRIRSRVEPSGTDYYEARSRFQSLYPLVKGWPS